MSTSIQWTDETWNFLVGCSRVSPGCEKCYAATAANSARLQRFDQYKTVKNWDGTIAFVEPQLYKPVKKRQSAKFFACSMSDVFHENVSDEWRDQAFAVMALSPQHIFQVLTKRPARMVEYFSAKNLYDRWLRAADKIRLDYPRLISIGISNPALIPPSWIWLGTTVEHKSVVAERTELIGRLYDRGWTTFYSCEPLLSNLNLNLLERPTSWIIAGGESGAGARRCDAAWIRSIVRQCSDASIPVFVKQAGSNFIDRA